MNEDLAGFIGEAQAMQSINGCSFKLEFGPTSAPGLIKTLEHILAGLIAKNNGKVTLEAIIAGGLRFMEQEINGDPATLNDVQKEAMQKVMRRVYGRSGGAKVSTNKTAKRAPRKK